jgi:hypothetical protein
LGAFLCGVIKSEISNSRKTWVRAQTVPSADAGEQTPSTGPSPEDLEEAEASRVFYDGVSACTKDDEVLGMLLLAIEGGAVTRAEIAAELGWTPEQVSAARIKLQRRVLERFPERFDAYRKKRGRR